VDLRALTNKFNEHINNRDADGLATVMTEDHSFIDKAGNAIRGKPRCLEAWRGFFAAFPDYRNIFERLMVQDESVVVSGRSSCADARLDGPALWVAKMKEGKVAEWRVYDDTPTLRRTLGLGP
jgi:ketosteroid isomerase-like protein